MKEELREAQGQVRLLEEKNKDLNYSLNVISSRIDALSSLSPN